MLQKRCLKKVWQVLPNPLRLLVCLVIMILPSFLNAASSNVSVSLGSGAGSANSATFTIAAASWKFDRGEIPSWITSVVMHYGNSSQLIFGPGSGTTTINVGGTAYFTVTASANTDGGARSWTWNLKDTAGNAVCTLSVSQSGSTPSSSYTVTYKPGANGAGSQQTATKARGSALILKGAIFTRSGYAQTGWATTDGGDKAYGLGASYTTDASVTLYPYWSVQSDSHFVIVNGVLTDYDGAGGAITIPSGVTTIGKEAFFCNKTITSVRFPDSVSLIDESAFYGCESLQGVVFGNGLKTIGDWAFEMTGLTSISIPANVEVIGDAAFNGCENLVSVGFENGIKKLGYAVFGGCTALPSIVIPASVEEIDDRAFQFCTALKSVTFMGNAPSVGESLFAYDNDISIFVKKGSTGWNGSGTTELPNVWPAGDEYARSIYYLNSSSKVSFGFPPDDQLYSKLGWRSALCIYDVSASEEQVKSYNPMLEFVEGSDVLYKFVYVNFGDTDMLLVPHKIEVLDKEYGIQIAHSEADDFAPSVVLQSGHIAYRDGWTWPILKNLEPGSYRLRITLDPDELFDDDDRTDNSAEFSFTVTPSGVPTTTYSVTYKPGANGTGSQQTATKARGSALTLKGAIFTRSGYAQTGWATKDGGDKVYGLGASYTTDASVTLYPYWTLASKSSNVSISLGSGAGSANSATFAIASASWKFNRGEIPSWITSVVMHYGNSSQLIFGPGSGTTTINVGGTAYFTVTASANTDGGARSWTWNLKDTAGNAVCALSVSQSGSTPISSYTVTYKPGVNGTGSQQIATKARGSALILKGAIFTRSGYTQTGWTTKDGGDKAYGLGASYTTDASVTLYPYWKEVPVIVTDPTIDEDEPMDAGVANTYDGVIVDADGLPLGSISIKAGKQSKAGRSKITATIQMAGEAKKVTVKGDVDVKAAEMTAKAADGRVLDLMFTRDTISGTFDGYQIEGMRNLLASKDKGGAKAEAEAALNKLLRNYAVAYEDDSGWNGLSVSVMKKGKVKISGALADGTKVSTSAQMIVGEDYSCIPVIYTKKAASISLSIYLSNDGSEQSVFGPYDAQVSAVGGLTGTRTFMVGGAIYDIFEDYELQGEFLPDGVSVAQKGTKWVVADGAKAGQIKLVDGEVIDKKESDNPSGLKLTFTAKTGIFKGSFKSYALDGKGKLKNFSTTVNGIVVDGVGYGTATIKKLGSFPITIE